MKAFIQKQFIMVIAFAMVLGFSAFNVIKTQLLVDNWHEVNEDGTIESTGTSTPPDDCPEDGEEYCALQITVNPGQPFPADVEQALLMKTQNKLTIDDERFRE